jgi:2'-hydroxyisoflavone reductase
MTVVARAARGGRMIVPGPLDAPVQFIDARDLTAWTLRQIEAKAGGVFNAVGPTAKIGDVLATARDIAGADTEFVSVDAAFLEERAIDPQSLDTWFIPQMEGGGIHPWETDASKAVRQGLTFRPLADTIRDSLAWDQSRPIEQRQKPALSAEREAELLRERETKA